MNTQDTQRLQEFLDKNPIITIIPHTNPDGDAIGSSLGLYLFLKAQNHNVKVITPTDFPDFLKWMPTADDILIYPNHEKEALWNDLRMALNRVDDENKKITLFAMQPMPGGNFKQEILGYSLMSALGIKGSELKD